MMGSHRWLQQGQRGRPRTAATGTRGARGQPSMAATGTRGGGALGLGEPGLDDALGDPHPDEVAEEAADGHQDADLPEGGAGNAEADD